MLLPRQMFVYVYANKFNCPKLIRLFNENNESSGQDSSVDVRVGDDRSGSESRLNDSVEMACS